MTNLLVWLLVGLVAGWLTGKVMRRKGYGMLGDIIIGLIGALIGGWIFGQLGIFSAGGIIGNIIVAFIGAVILVVILRTLKKA